MKQLIASKRSLFSLIVLGCATLLLLVGRLTGDQWIDLTKLLTTTLLVGHTVSHAVETTKRQQSPLPIADVVNDK
jgi:hypothetical protein